MLALLTSHPTSIMANLEDRIVSQLQNTGDYKVLIQVGGEFLGSALSIGKSLIPSVVSFATHKKNTATVNAGTSSV